MTPGEAAGQIEYAVRQQVRQVKTGVDARLPRAANALRNAELTVLSGNPSPAPPGSPPGRRSGFLRTAWTMYTHAGDAAMFGILSAAPYAGYLEEGTSKMAARPFADRIRQTALPEVCSIFEEVR